MTQPTPKASPTPKATPKAKPQIQIQIQILPIQPQDLPALALLESHVFLHDPFSITAFGLEKDGAENLAVRVKGLEKTLAGRNGKRTVHMKAIVEGEIVGWSSWSFVHVGEEGEEDEKMEVEVEKEKEKGDKVIGDGQMGEGEGEVDDHDGWGITANVKFCRDVFLVADGWMVDVTKGEDYASKSLSVSHRLSLFPPSLSFLSLPTSLLPFPLPFPLPSPPHLLFPTNENRTQRPHHPSPLPTPRHRNPHALRRLERS